MAWIIGVVNKEELSRIQDAGYEIDEFLTLERVEEIFPQKEGQINDDECRPEEDEQWISMYVDCDVTDFLSLDGK